MGLDDQVPPKIGMLTTKPREDSRCRPYCLLRSVLQMEPCGAASPGDAASQRRGIGPHGTAARIIVGLGLLVGVIDRAAGWVGIFGSSSAGFRPAAWALGLVGLPAGLLVWQWLRARRNPAPLRALGPKGFVLNTMVIVALLLTPWYAPPLAITFETALIFYGASMLLAAARGYAGCEVLAVSNWLLRRDDQVGCLIFAPLDYAERGRRDGRGGDGE